MSKREIQPSKDQHIDSVGLDFLREIAAFPHRTVAASKHQQRQREVVIERDAQGNIIRSTERIVELDVRDIDGFWAD